MPKVTKPAPKQAPPKRVPKKDGWINVLTGIGMAGRDKSITGVCFQPDLMAREELELIWRGDDMAARIVELLPHEMMREGYQVKIQAEDGGDPDSTDSEKGADGAEIDEQANKGGARSDAPPPKKPPEDQGPKLSGKLPSQMLMPPKVPKPITKSSLNDAKMQSEQVMAKLEELQVNDKLLETLCYERAYGGGALLLGADDGSSNLNKPLNKEKIKTFDWLNVLTPRELYPVRYYTDPSAPNYGEVEIYRLMPVGMPVAQDGSTAPKKSQKNNVTNSVEVHESRLILFKGIKVSRQQLLQNNGWGDSVLVRCKRVLEQFHQTWGSAAVLLQDFSQAVMKIKDLADLIATDQDDVVVRRAQAVDMSRSVARAIMIDSEEEWERKPTPMSGMPEMLDKFSLRLASTSEYPVTLLMGQAPAGLNATGDSDIRFFYDKVRSKQNSRLRPALARLVELVFLTKDGPTKGKEPKNWSVDFNPLWQPSITELAEVKLNAAKRDKLYVDMGALTPEEVAGSRFGGDSWSDDTTLDLEGRAEMEKMQAANPPPQMPGQDPGQNPVDKQAPVK